MRLKRWPNRALLLPLLLLAAMVFAGAYLVHGIAESALLPSALRSQFASELAMIEQDTPELGDAPVSYRVDCASPNKWGDGP